MTVQAFLGSITSTTSIMHTLFRIHNSAQSIFSTSQHLVLTYPPRTSLPEETLGFQGIGFSPMLHPLTLTLQPKTERSPTDYLIIIITSANYLVPFIFGAGLLDHNYLGALAGDLGCFPLDNGAYPP
ncbi:unnamed protein product [Pylaiella littoralis]